MTLFSAFDAVTRQGAAANKIGGRIVPRQVDSGAAKRLPAATESADVGAMSNAPPALPTTLEAALALLASERAR